MNKNKITKTKLKLRRDTARILTLDQLSIVAGGCITTTDPTGVRTKTILTCP